MKKMKSFLLFAAMAAITGLMITACSDDKDDAQTLSVDKTEISAPAAGGAFSIAVTSSGAWAAAVSPASATWCTITPKAGVSNGTITVNVAANNTGTSPQTATVTVTQGQLSKQVSITQEGTAFILSLTPAEQTAIAFAADGTTTDNAAFAVFTTHSAWDAVSSQVWCIVTKTGAGFTVSAAPNTALTAPIPATVTVTAGEATPVVINVTQAAAPLDGFTQTVGGVSFDMVGVAGGTFTMGATPEQGSETNPNEYPTHEVTLSAFFIGKTEVTQALWFAVMKSYPGDGPGSGVGDDYPMNNVTYAEVQNFITTLNGLTGGTFRLPTEAEWEYAARGGSNSAGYKYSGSNDEAEVAWCNWTTGWAYHGFPVGQLAANELGLFDMSGNVDEFVSDWFGNYSGNAQTDPQGPESGDQRLSRGGNWYGGEGDCRVAHRGPIPVSHHASALGFRLVSSNRPQ